MNELINKIKKNKLIYTIRVDDLNELSYKIKNIKNNGIDILEITYRTTLTLEGIKLVKQNFSEFKVGCGTVLNLEQLENAIKAGADFIVTPGFNEKIVKKCIENKIFIIPRSCNTD